MFSRFFSLAGVSAREALEEPLSPVLFLFAYVSIHLLPVFHYHRFGEAAQLPRECALSALLVCGTWFSAAAAVRILSREISSGTAAAVIAAGAGRGEFFLAKLAGVWGSLWLFAAGAFFAGSLACTSALAGAALFDEGLQETATWGPGLAFGSLSAIAAFAAAAAANRFGRLPFASTACKYLAVSQIVAFAAASFFVDGAWRVAASLATPFIVLALAAMVFAAIGAAGAAWLSPGAAAAATALAVASSLVFPFTALVPAMRGFWLSDAVAHGGAAMGEVARLAGAAAALCIFWAVLGACGIRRKDIS